jgi:hypothetical protein
MSDFMGDYVSLRKFAGRAKALLELIEEAEIEIDLFVARAIEGSGGHACSSASGWISVAVEDEFCVTVWHSLLHGQCPVPVFLYVIENERNQLHFGPFAFAASGVGLAVSDCLRLRRIRTATGQHLEKILMEDEAEHADDDRAADAQMYASEPAAAESAATILSSIFDVAAGASGRPSHEP